MTPSKQIIEVLDYLGQKLGITIDWTAANVMPYMQDLFTRFIEWEIATSTVWIILGCILSIIAVVIIFNFKKILDQDDEDMTIFSILIILILLAIGVPIIITQIFDIIECLTIPEKVLYEYASELIK